MNNLEEEIAKLRENKTFVVKICDDVSFSRLNTGYNSELIFNLVVGRTVGSAVFQEEKEFDVDNIDEIKKDKKELEKNMLHTPMKVIARSLPLMLGTAGMVYDMSLLSKQLENVGDPKSSQASDSIREMSVEMEKSLGQILSFKTIEESHRELFVETCTDSISGTESHHDSSGFEYSPKVPRQGNEPSKNGNTDSVSDYESDDCRSEFSRHFIN